MGVDVGGHVDDGVILLRIHQRSPDPDHKEQSHVPGQYPDGCLAQFFQPDHSQKERNRQEKEAHKGEKAHGIVLLLGDYAQEDQKNTHESDQNGQDDLYGAGDFFTTCAGLAGIVQGPASQNEAGFQRGHRILLSKRDVGSVFTHIDAFFRD